MVPILYLFSDWAFLALRVVLGLIMLAHGKPKMENLDSTVENFKEMGFKPAKLWVWIAIAIELVGGLALVLGFLTQTFALIIAVQFLIILVTVKRGADFRGGYEFDLLILAAALVLATAGGGIYSLDQFFNLTLY